MPAPSAAAIRLVSASRDIMVPVGLAGLPTRTPLSGVLAVRGKQRFAGQRMPGFARGFDQTGSQPSAVRMCRYGG